MSDKEIITIIREEARIAMLNSWTKKQFLNRLIHQWFCGCEVCKYRNASIRAYQASAEGKE